MSVETTGALTNAAVTIAANVDRKGVLIGNNSDTAMTVRCNGGTATAAAGLPIPANTTLRLESGATGAGAISLFCAGTSKAYTIYEW